MKVFFKSSILYSVVFMLIGCNNFLNEEPRGNTIAKTTSDYDKLFNDYQCFNLQLIDQYYPLWKSDDLIFTNDCFNSIAMSGNYPSSVKAAIEYKDKIYQDDEMTPEWTKITNLIYTYNVIIDGIRNAIGNEEEKVQLLAEARVARAYMHFLLAQWFAMPYNIDTPSKELSIPIITTPDSQQLDFDLVTVEDLYNWITLEMKEACPDLLAREEHRMRCYKATGYALYGKVLFYMCKYDQAKEVLEISYNLLRSDPNVFLTNHNIKQKKYGYKELDMFSLLEYIPYPYKDNEVLYCKCSMGMRQYFPPYYYMTPTDFLKPEIYDLYTEYDLRRNLICTKDLSGNEYPYPTATFLGSMTNLGCTIQEVYLMLSECEARCGTELKARSILEELRATRIMEGHELIPSEINNREKLIHFCIDEWSREFAGTGMRFYTLRRLWNDPLFQDIKPITHTVGDEIYIMNETNLKSSFPETLLIWNENWRN